jgi:hypothetical protein
MPGGTRRAKKPGKIAIIDVENHPILRACQVILKVDPVFNKGVYLAVDLPDRTRIVKLRIGWNGSVELDEEWTVSTKVEEVMPNA